MVHRALRRLAERRAGRIDGDEGEHLAQAPAEGALHAQVMERDEEHQDDGADPLEKVGPVPAVAVAADVGPPAGHDHDAVRRVIDDRQQDHRPGNQFQEGKRVDLVHL